MTIFLKYFLDSEHLKEKGENCDIFFFYQRSKKGGKLMRVRAIITSVDVNVYDGRADMRNARPFSQIIVSRRHYRRFTFSRDADVISPQNLTLVAPKCADVFFKCKLMDFCYFLRSTSFWTTNRACLDMLWFC